MKHRTVRKPKLALVQWKDAMHHSGWRTRPDTSDERFSQFTAGYIIHRSKRYVHVAQTLDDQEPLRFADVMIIPKSEIVRTRYLK